MNYNIILRDASTGAEAVIDTIAAERQTDAKRLAGRKYAGRYDPVKQQLIVSRDTARNRRLIEERNRIAGAEPAGLPQQAAQPERVTSSRPRKPRKLTKQEERRKTKYPDTASFHWKNENTGGKITGDCVIRAISTATGQTWEETAQGLYEMMLKTHLVLNGKDCYSKYLESNGWTKHTQPRKGDNTKYTGAEFCEWLNDHHDGGNVIAHIGGHHIVAIIPVTPEGPEAEWAEPEYKVIDTWNSTKGCIGNYWTKP